MHAHAVAIAVADGVEVGIATLLLVGFVWLYIWCLRETAHKLDRLNRIERFKQRHPRVS